MNKNDWLDAIPVIVIVFCILILLSMKGFNCEIHINSATQSTTR